MNIVHYFKRLFVFIPLLSDDPKDTLRSSGLIFSVFGRSIDVLDSKDQPGSGSGKMWTGEDV